MPECQVYAMRREEALEGVAVGIADAIALRPDGAPQLIVDWKSDVDPSQETIEHYRAQVRAYLDITETESGLIVLMTSGVAIPVTGGVGGIFRD